MKFIDLHCHSTLKPYSKSFKKGLATYKNNKNYRKENSIWHQDLPTRGDQFLNKFLTVTKFRQSDFRTSLEGGCKVMMVSIDPMEKALVHSKLNKPDSLIIRMLKNFVTGIGIKRIKYLQKLNDYYKDLYRNYKFLEELNLTPLEIEGNVFKYNIIDNYSDIDMSDGIINIVLTIEGGHVFNTGLELADVITDANDVLFNAKRLKSKEWKFKPFFISLAHHFSNLLCGHAQSFEGISKKFYSQRCNPSEGISVMGFAVIDILLSKTNGKRILIDIKHMNPKSRSEYFNYLDSNYNDERIPIVVSHGALSFKDYPKPNSNQINFFDYEISLIAKSGGIFGIQLDERRLLLRAPKEKVKEKSLNEDKKRRNRANLVWRQIERIAILLYEDESFDGDPWGIQAIGSDFDGIIDPMEGYFTHKDMPYLINNLFDCAENFLNTPRAKALDNYSILNAREIIEKFHFINANKFLSKNL